MKVERVIQLAKKYWKIRDRGDIGELRTIAHNNLMDALDAIGIQYHDRDEAARIGAELMQLTTLSDILRYAARQENQLAENWMKMVESALLTGHRLQATDLLSMDIISTQTLQMREESKTWWLQ